MGVVREETSQHLVHSVEKVVRRQLAFYNRVRQQVAEMDLDASDPLRSALDRTWEAVYGLGLVLETHAA